MFDAQLYRSKSEIEEWKVKCPIAHLEKWMVQAGVAHPDDLSKIENRIKSDLERAVDFAEGGSLEPVENLARHVLYEKATP